MPAEMIAFDAEARDRLKAGVDALADAVRVTLGPRGRTVAIDRKWGLPTVINSGVVVAREIELPDPLQNMGAQLLKQAAIKTSENAGDGTTTSTILAQAIVSEGLRAMDFGSEHYVDMLDAGIIDPAKVTRGALQNAASVAATILTTEALVTDAPEPANEEEIPATCAVGERCAARTQHPRDTPTGLPPGSTSPRGVWRCACFPFRIYWFVTWRNRRQH